MLKTLILAIAAAAALIAQTGQGTVFKRNVFNGATIAAASAPLPNIGQAVHIMMVYFPSAVADVSGFTIRVEGSFDNSVYFPISEDVTTAIYNGTYGYNISRCNGPYPYVRLRYVTAHASLAMTAHYTGALQPIGLVRLSGTRYITDSPLAGTTVSEPGQTISGTYYVQNRRMTPITAADWTSVNFHASTVRYNDTNSITVFLPAAATTGTWNMLCKALPSPPYTIRIHYISEYTYAGADGLNIYGPILRNSSDGKLVSWTLGGTYNGAFIHQNWNSPSSLNASFANGAVRVTGAGTVQSLTIVDDNTNRSYSQWNGTRGLTHLIPNSAFWHTSVLRTDFTTPDQICFGVSHENGNYNNIASLVGYDVNPTW